MSLPAAAGPADTSLPPQDRVGVLWDVYRALLDDGWAVDADGYTTNFRVRVKGGRTAEELHQQLDKLPEQLTYSFNMKTADVYPAAAGKAAAAQRVLERLGGSWSSSLMLCDDDNDLQLAYKCAKAFVPGLTALAPSMRKVSSNLPEHRYTGVI